MMIYDSVGWFVGGNVHDTIDRHIGEKLDIGVDDEV